VRLDDFEQRGDKHRPRFVTEVEDASGQARYELAVAGPDHLMRRAFADTTFDLTIDSNKSQGDFEPQLLSVREGLYEQHWTAAGLEDLPALFKPTVARPRPDNSIVAALRPVEFHGTPFSIRISSFTVLAGTNLFFMGSLVAIAVGSLTPLTGDQDLYLRLYGAGGPVVSSSRASFTATDNVWFTMPFPFVPVYQVQGFTTGVCGTFTAGGL
jgi:hypothetical protein